MQIKYNYFYNVYNRHRSRCRDRRDDIERLSHTSLITLVIENLYLAVSKILFSGVFVPAETG